MNIATVKAILLIAINFSLEKLRLFFTGEKFYV
jgi:hypothetical protein